MNLSKRPMLCQKQAGGYYYLENGGQIALSGNQMLVEIQDI